MARIRRSSNAIAKAIVRSNNLKTISPTLDLGGGLTVAAFDAKVAEAQAAENEYNQLLAGADEKANRLDALLKELSGMNTRMLAGVGARWGKNSDEYEKAGGSRTDEIRRARKSKKNGDNT
jgi:hypothetical protein